MRFACVLGLLIACAGISCSGSSGDKDNDDAGEPTSVAYADLRAQQFRAQCEKSIGCNSLRPDNDIANCVDALASAHPRNPALDPAVEEGSVMYDPEKAAACLSATRAASCEDTLYNVPIAACAETFTGTVALGGNCFVSEQCAGNAYCDNGDVCPGTCVERKPLGEVCNSSKECGPAGSSVCATLQCKSVQIMTAQLDQPCGYNETSTLVKVTSCTAGLSCVRSTINPQVGTCKAPIAIGAPCTSRQDTCVSGASCRDPGDGSLVCMNITLVSEAGGTCGSIEDPTATELCDSSKGLECMSNRCRLPGNGEVESACRSLIYGTSTCNEGLYCDNGGLQCREKLADGEECTQDVQCATGSCRRGSAIGAMGTCGMRGCL